MKERDSRTDGHGISRREFAERLALAVAAPLVLEDLSPVFPLSAPRRGGQGVRTQQPEPSPLAKALAEGIRLRYPDRLSADDLQTITRGIDGRLRGLARLYEATLTNGDEPDFVFAVYRGAAR